MTAVPSIPGDRHDDRILLRAWSRGRDEAAFTQFVLRHLGMVQGIALRKTSRPELAEDVAQAVFALAARRAAALAEHPCADAWLLRTAILESANALRRELKQRKIAAAMLVEPDTSPDPAADGGLPRALLPHLDDALNALPEHDRRAVMLRFGERLSYDQMAARLGKSADACQKQTSRALERLRGLLAGRAAAVTVTAIAASVTASLTTPATAAAAGKVSAAAIAAAPHISLAAVIHHLIHTMHTGKQIALAAGAVALLAAVPLGLNYSEAGTLRGQLTAPQPVSRAVTAPAKASASPATAPREVPGSRIRPGVSTAEADRTVAMLRSLRGRMITSLQLVDITQKLLDLPLSHMPEAIKVLADFPGMIPAVPLRVIIFSRWAELDPDAALAAGTASKPDIFSEDMIQYALAAGWLERDPQGLIAWLHQHPRHPSAGGLCMMLGENISLLDRQSVEQLRDLKPAGGYHGQLLMLWEKQAENGDVKALAKELLTKTTDNLERGEILSDVANSLLEDDPRAALEFVLSPPGLEGGNVNEIALETVMESWARKDLDAAAAWVWSQNEKYKDATNHVWRALSQKSEEEILAFLAKAPDEVARLHSLRRTALESASTPEKALHLLASLPDAPRHLALEDFGKIRASESLMQTSEWLLELPEGPDKDAAIRGFAPVLARSEAESAMIWAAAITNQNERTDLLLRVSKAWLKNAPDAARQWINSTEKLTDADRAAITSNQ